MNQSIHSPNDPNNSQSQNLTRPAKEKVRKIISTQQAALKKKFDQIRSSLSEKEMKVNQELAEILDKRLTELDTCARNIDALSSTINVSQQTLAHLGTNTLGSVNLKIQTAVNSAMEEYRDKIDAELNISILWGNHDIEGSIQSICTVTYMSEAKGALPTALPNATPINNQIYYECSVCKAVTTSSDHRCHKPEQLYRTHPPHDQKEPLSVRQIFPAVYIPMEGSVTSRATNLVQLNNHKSLESTSMVLCTVCDSHFQTILELEKHQKDQHSTYHGNTNEQRFRPIRGTKTSVPPSMSHTDPLHSERTAQHSHYSNPDVQQPQPNLPTSQHQPNPDTYLHQPMIQGSHYQPNRPTGQHQPNPDTYLHQPMIQGSHYQPNRPTGQHQPNPDMYLHQPMIRGSHYQPNRPTGQHQPNPEATLHQPRIVGPDYQPNRPTGQHQPNPEATLHQPRIVGPDYQPRLQSKLPYTLPEPISQQANSEPPTRMRSVSQIQQTPYRNQKVRDYRRFEVRLVWYKEVHTMAPQINYFDNFDGRCDLVWDKREECYSCIVELEEGDHFGQLTLSDSVNPHPVEKFSLPGRSGAMELIILRIVPRH